MRVKPDADLEAFIVKEDASCFTIRGLPPSLCYAAFNTYPAALAYLNANIAAVNAARARIKTRRCMCCTKEFHSAGSHNRLCDHCRKLGEY